MGLLREWVWWKGLAELGRPQLDALGVHAAAFAANAERIRAENQALLEAAQALRGPVPDADPAGSHARLSELARQMVRAERLAEDTAAAAQRVDEALAAVRSWVRQGSDLAQADTSPIAGRRAPLSEALDALDEAASRAATRTETAEDGQRLVETSQHVRRMVDDAAGLDDAGASPTWVAERLDVAADRLTTVEQAVARLRATAETAATEATAARIQAELHRAPDGLPVAAQALRDGFADPEAQRALDQRWAEITTRARGDAASSLDTFLRRQQARADAEGIPLEQQLAGLARQRAATRIGDVEGLVQQIEQMLERGLADVRPSSRTEVRGSIQNAVDTAAGLFERVVDLQRRHPDADGFDVWRRKLNGILKNLRISSSEFGMSSYQSGVGLTSGPEEQVRLPELFRETVKDLQGVSGEIDATVKHADRGETVEEVEKPVSWRSPSGLALSSRIDSVTSTADGVFFNEIKNYRVLSVTTAGELRPSILRLLDQADNQLTILANNTEYHVAPGQPPTLRYVFHNGVDPDLADLLERLTVPVFDLEHDGRVIGHARLVVEGERIRAGVPLTPADDGSDDAGSAAERIAAVEAELRNRLAEARHLRSRLSDAGDAAAENARAAEADTRRLAELELDLDLGDLSQLGLGLDEDGVLRTPDLADIVGLQIKQLEALARVLELQEALEQISREDAEAGRVSGRASEVAERLRTLTDVRLRLRDAAAYADGLGRAAEEWTAAAADAAGRTDPRLAEVVTAPVARVAGSHADLADVLAQARALQDTLEQLRSAAALAGPESFQRRVDELAVAEHQLRERLAEARVHASMPANRTGADTPVRLPAEQRASDARRAAELERAVDARRRLDGVRRPRRPRPVGALGRLAEAVQKLDAARIAEAGREARVADRAARIAVMVPADLVALGDLQRQLDVRLAEVLRLQAALAGRTDAAEVAPRDEAATAPPAVNDLRLLLEGALTELVALQGEVAARLDVARRTERAVDIGLAEVVEATVAGLAATAERQERVAAALADARALQAAVQERRAELAEAYREAGSAGRRAAEVHARRSERAVLAYDLDQVLGAARRMQADLTERSTPGVGADAVRAAADAERAAALDVSVPEDLAVVPSRQRQLAETLAAVLGVQEALAAAVRTGMEPRTANDLRTQLDIQVRALVAGQEDVDHRIRAATRLDRGSADVGLREVVAAALDRAREVAARQAQLADLLLEGRALQDLVDQRRAAAAPVRSVPADERAAAIEGRVGQIGDLQRGLGDALTEARGLRETLARQRQAAAEAASTADSRAHMPRHREPGTPPRGLHPVQGAGSSRADGRGPGRPRRVRAGGPASPGAVGRCPPHARRPRRAALGGRRRRPPRRGRRPRAGTGHRAASGRAARPAHLARQHARRHAGASGTAGPVPAAVGCRYAGSGGSAPQRRSGAAHAGHPAPGRRPGACGRTGASPAGHGTARTVGRRDRAGRPPGDNQRQRDQRPGPDGRRPARPADPGAGRGGRAAGRPGRHRSHRRRSDGR